MSGCPRKEKAANLECPAETLHTASQFAEEYWAFKKSITKFDHAN